MTHTWLAFDVGTTGAKAALIDNTGRVLASATRSYPDHDGAPGEQDPRAWWAACVEAARALGLGLSDAGLAGIAVTGQMQDVILLDADGAPVRPAILYSDHRATDEIADVHAVLGEAALTQRTGNAQTASSLLAKLLWLKRHEPDSLARAAHLLVGAGDDLVYRLTGIAACDTTTASTTGLLDLDARAWLDAASFAALGLADVPRLLPPVGAGGRLIGPLRTEAALALGLPAGLPVHLAPGDAGATTLGVGSGAVGAPYAYIGTSGWVAYTSASRGSPTAGVFTLAHPDPALALCIAPILTAGGNLDWAKDALAFTDHDAMIAAALARPLSAPLYLPYLNGERSPFSDPAARGAFIGLNAAHTADDLARAVLEGVAFAFRHALDALLDVPPTALTMTGGGARSSGWPQLFADVTGLTVRVAADAEHVGARGAALAAGVARGGLAHYTPAGWFMAEAEYAPRADLTAAYTGKYALFREAYPALRAIFAGLAEVQ